MIKRKRDEVKNLSELQQQVREFVAQRNREKAHSPKNLAMSVAIEAAELMEIFRWENADHDKIDEKTREHEAEEIDSIIQFKWHCNDDSLQCIELLKSGEKNKAYCFKWILI